MKWTNKYNLPDTILRAAHVNDAKYNKGNVERSATQIIQPPRIDMLRKAHFAELEKDISEEWWALFGSAVHHILEMGVGPKDLVEERMFCEIDGWAISGMADLQEHHLDGSVSISDYKVTTAFVLMKDETVKPEWEQQLNILAYLFHRNKPDLKVRDLAIVAIVRDWQRREAAIDPLYPRAPVVPVKVPLWSTKKQEAYIKERIRLHRTAEMLHDIGEPMPECTDEERWMRNSSWAVIKEGGKKATRVYASEQEAKADLQTRKAGFHIELRQGNSVRCEGDYCQVSRWCEQWKKLKETGDNATENQQAA